MAKNRFVFFFSVGVVLLVLLICNPLGLYFLCDDFAHIPRAIRGDLFQTHLLRPVANISLWLDGSIWGLEAAGFHTTNLLLHIISSVLVFFLTKAILHQYELQHGKYSLVPLFASLIFLCYGFHAEPIFWIVGRGASLSTIFIQLSLLFFLKEKLFFSILSLLCFTIGLFTYEFTWMLPFFVSLMAIYAQVMLAKGSLLKKISYYWLVFFAYLWYRFFFLKYSLPYGSHNVMDGEYFVLLRNTLTLLARLYTPPYQNSVFFVLHFLTVTTVLLFLCYRAFRYTKEIFFFLSLIGVVVLISVLPAMPLGIDTHDTESERFIYLASMFASIFFVLLLYGAVRRVGYIYLFLGLTIVINLAYLYNASRPYRYASYLSEFVVRSLNTAPFAKKLTFTNLPSQYKGGLLFRIGFVKYSPGILTANYDDVTILSYQEIKEAVPFTLSPVSLDSSRKELFVDFTNNQMIIHQ